MLEPGPGEFLEATGQPGDLTFVNNELFDEGFPRAGMGKGDFVFTRREGELYRRYFISIEFYGCAGLYISDVDNPRPWMDIDLHISGLGRRCDGRCRLR